MASPYDPSTRPSDPPPVEGPDPRASLVQYRVGGRDYSAVFHRNCHTCTHPARTLIEEKVILNYPFRQIAEMYSGREILDQDNQPIRLPVVAWTSIANHYRKKHMPLEFQASRAIVEQRAEAMGKDIEESAQRIVHHRDVLQSIVEQGHDMLQQKRLELGAADVIRAIRVIEQIDARTEAENVDNDVWSSALQAIFETARRILPPPLWAQFTRELSSNPVLRALEAKENGEDIVDAEIVEERPS